MIRRGRPLGEEARTVLAAIAEEPMTARDLAQTLRLSQSRADRIAFNLRQSGHLEVAHTEPAQGRRPVNVYRAASWVRSWGE